MSLVDALLLDPYKFHVWILPRTDGGLRDGPYVFPRILLRGNIIRHAARPDPLAVGVNLNSCGELTVEKNIITLQRPDSLLHIDCGAFRYFNNLKSGGALLRGYNRNINSYNMETQDEIDDVFLLSLKHHRL